MATGINMASMALELSGNGVLAMPGAPAFQFFETATGARKSWGNQFCVEGPKQEPEKKTGTCSSDPTPYLKKKTE